MEKLKLPTLNWLWPLASSGLLAIAAVVPTLGWLALVGLLPFCLYIRQQQQRVIFGSWLLGFAYMLVVYSWFLQTRPTNWTALASGVAWQNQLVLWVVAALALSIAFWLLGVALQFMKDHLSVNRLMLCLIVLWPLMELLRGLIFSVIAYGQGGSVGPFWNFGNLGLSVMSTPLGFATRLTGFFGLSAVVVAVNLAIYWLINRQHKQLALSLLGCVALLSFAGFIWPQHKLPLTATLVHASPQNEGIAVDKLKFGQPADLIVMPEASDFDAAVSGQLINTALKPTGTLVTSVVGHPHPSQNEIIQYSPQAGLYSRQAKTFLIPTGEYVPYFINGYFKWLRQTNWIDQFKTDRQILRGNRPEQAVMTPAGYRLGALSCSGILVPQFYQRLSRQGAEVLVNTASLRFLSGASLFKAQALLMARFDAIANAKYFIQSSRGDVSFVLDSNGHKITSVTGPTQAVPVSLYRQSTPTLYSQFGELFLIVLIIGAAGYFVQKVNKLRF